MEEDAADHARKCDKCQYHGNRIHAPPGGLHAMSTPWPFHTWAMDLIGPLGPSQRNEWILVATECFTKWVEAVPLVKATGINVSTFIKEFIVYRFGIPRRILTDNGTPFINKDVAKVTEQYQINHIKSTPYYPQGNGQAEATNKTLLKTLARMVGKNPKFWAAKLPLTLWAYRTSIQGPTQASPFTLVYGCEAVVPVELKVPSPRMVLGEEASEEESRYAELEALEENRERVRSHMKTYQERMTRAYDKKVRPRIFKKGDMVLRAATHVMRGLSAPKFTPKWEGPFIVHEAMESGYLNLFNPTTGNLTGHINSRWVKRYYS